MNHAHPEHTPALSKATDPVCGMPVDQETTVHRVERGAWYFFCGAGCKRTFEADPDRYLRPSAATSDPGVPAGTIYTCPMHPQIRQVGPGYCPICGMGLEPVEATAAVTEPRAGRHDSTVLGRAPRWQFR